MRWLYLMGRIHLAGFSFLCSVVALLLGGGLLALIIAQQFVFFIGIFIRRNLAIKSLRREGLAYNKPIFVTIFLKWFAQKHGEQRVLFWAVSNDRYILYRLSLRKRWLYLLMIKLMNVTVDFSRAFCKIPRLSKKAVGNFLEKRYMEDRLGSAGICFAYYYVYAGETYLL